jgi:Trk K+ transport system NAD-binding subunit
MVSIHNLFIVCGLGRLGQACVAALKEFGVTVHGIDLQDPPRWEIADVSAGLDDYITGDCRQAQVLDQARVRACRAVLLVTSDERVNIAAAFAVRALHPTARLVVRSAEDNLNHLLAQQLGNFVAYEATQLPAPSFALAALGSETRGFFSLDDHLMRVVRQRLDAHHRWCDRPRQLHELSGPARQLLSHIRPGDATPTGFYQWDPTTSVQPGDNLTYIEVAEPFLAAAPGRSASSHRGGRLGRLLDGWYTLRHRTEGTTVRQILGHLWQASTQTQRVGILSSLVMLSLFVIGMVLYKVQYPTMDWPSAFNVALVLALGGFDNLFGNFKLDVAMPWWLYGLSIGMTIAGTIFIGILYAILTERVLASQLHFTKRRPSPPRTDHVVIVGLGRVGTRVATLLQQFRQPIVGVNPVALDATLLPDIAIITGPLKEAIRKANLETAKSVIVVTDDEVANLELGLMVRSHNPTCTLVIRALDPLFADNVARLLPEARVFGAYAVAAEAFAAAAFGENILDLFRLNNRTTLVTEYQVEAGDSLADKLLAEIAYGYGVVPILHQRRSPDRAKSPPIFPPKDTLVQAGDRLVVLATMADLQQVEQGRLDPPQWRVYLQSAPSADAQFEGAQVLTRYAHCELGLAKRLMGQLPTPFPRLLYHHQALHLVHRLRKARVSAHAEAAVDQSPTRP